MVPAAVSALTLTVAPVGVLAEWGNDRECALRQRRFDLTEPHFLDLADKAEIDRRDLAFGLRREALREQHALAGNANRAPAEAVELLHDPGVDMRVEHFLDDADGLLIGDAQAVDEARLQPRIAHALGDRFSAAVDEHGLDADGVEKDDVAQEALDDLLVFHGAAAVLNDEALAAKFLDVRERLDERFDTNGGCVWHFRKQ